MRNFSLSCSAKQSKKTQENFEKNKHKLSTKTTQLNPDSKLTLLPIDEDMDLGNAGDFRSKDCIELLKQSDIVVTNPPFSLFREYVAQLIEYEKKFLIIGNLHAITYKDFFPYLKNNQIWQGYTHPKLFIDANAENKDFKQFGNIGWYSNLDIKKRNEPLETIASYTKNPEKYPKYDNYDAINVDKTNEIPLDYEGVMGVPITFLDKHNPKQFEILGLDDHRVEWRGRGPDLKGKTLYRRLIIRRIPAKDHKNK